jgi:hypothetical protein
MATRFSCATSLALLLYPWFLLASVTPLAEGIAFVVSCRWYGKDKGWVFQLLLMSAISQRCVCSVCGKRVHVMVDRTSPLVDINSCFSTNLLSLNIDKTHLMQVVTKNSSLIDLYSTH